MKIAYVTDEENRLMNAQAAALSTRHEVDLIGSDDSTDGYDVVITAGNLPDVLAVDDDYYRTRTRPENEPLRVLLAGASQRESDAVEHGYGAAAHARWFHQKFDLVRVAPWAPSREEPLDDVQEFHVALDEREMSRLMQTCDALIAQASGLTLLVAQALAAGVAVVMASTQTVDCALSAPPEHAVELGEKLIELLSDSELRDRLRARGREVAEQWRSDANVARLEEIIWTRAAKRP